MQAVQVDARMFARPARLSGVWRGLPGKETGHRPGLVRLCLVRILRPRQRRALAPSPQCGAESVRSGVFLGRLGNFLLL